MGYLLCAFGGFLFGVVITCILLAKKNLERYQMISKVAGEKMKQSISNAKGTYNAYLLAHGVTPTAKGSDEQAEEEPSEEVSAEETAVETEPAEQEHEEE